MSGEGGSGPYVPMLVCGDHENCEPYGEHYQRLHGARQAGFTSEDLTALHADLDVVRAGGAVHVRPSGRAPGGAA